MRRDVKHKTFSDSLQAIAYLLIQEALKSQMGAAVRQRAEEEELEDMPLMELLRLVSGPSHREEVDRVSHHEDGRNKGGLFW